MNGQLEKDLSSDVDPEFKGLVNHAELREINLHRVLAERLSSAWPDGVTVNILPEWASEESAGRMVFRYTATCTLTANSEPVVHVETVYGVVYSLSGEPPARSLVEAFANNVGLLAVYPYIRQSVQSRAQELGFNGLVLGLLRMGEGAPQNVTMKLHPPVGNR